MSKTTTTAVSALVKAGFSQADAEALVAATQAKTAPKPKADPKIAALVALGFDAEEAAELAAKSDAKAEANKTPKQKAEALVEASEYDFWRGLVRVPFAALEQIIDTLETGEPAIVPLDGEHKTRALLIWAQETRDAEGGKGGMVVVQNLQ